MICLLLYITLYVFIMAFISAIFKKYEKVLKPYLDSDGVVQLVLSILWPLAFWFFLGIGFYVFLLKLLNVEVKNESETHD